MIRDSGVPLCQLTPSSGTGGGGGFKALLECLSGDKLVSFGVF